MKGRPVGGILALAAVLAMPSMGEPLSAQMADLIIDRHVSALGGREALESIRTMTYVRTVQNTVDGATTIQSRTLFLTKRPYLYRTERPERGRLYVSNGSTAWSGNRRSDTGIVVWEEESRLLSLRDLDFDRPFGSFIDYRHKGHSATYVGTTELDGDAQETILVAWRDGGSWEYYFDPSTGLCSGWDGNPGEAGGLIRVDDYRRVGDVLLPHRNLAVDSLPEGGARIHERIYSDFELNVPLSDAMFRGGADGKRGARR